MSPKQHILRALTLAGEPGTVQAHLRPSDLPGYGRASERYQAAVNELLRQKLIEGHSDGDGRMSIALNPHRLRDIRKALRPVWARPSVWAAAAATLAAVGIGLAI
jgi:hypothetical protein